MNQQWPYSWLYAQQMPFEANQQYYYFIPLSQGLGTYQDVPAQAVQHMEHALPSEERAVVESPEPTSSSPPSRRRKEIPRNA